MESVPKNSVWVRARAECSLEHIFLRLAKVIESDVKAIQMIDGRQGDRPYGAKFTCTKSSETKLVVTKTRALDGGEAKTDSVIFERSASGITAKDGRTDKRMFLAKPLLTGDAECKLAIEGETDLLELWQVSRRALEDLFFSA